MALTRVDFSVAAHTIGIHDALEASGEAVGPHKCWRHVPAGYAMSNSTHSFLALECPVERQTLMMEASEILEPPPMRSYMAIFEDGMGWHGGGWSASPCPNLGHLQKESVPFLIPNHPQPRDLTLHHQVRATMSPCASPLHLVRGLRLLTGSSHITTALEVQLYNYLCSLQSLWEIRGGRLWDQGHLGNALGKKASRKGTPLSQSQGKGEVLEA